MQVYHHQPVEEGRCKDCHVGEEMRGNARFSGGVPELVAPLQELCFLCHDQPEGRFVHGPSATGDCWTCHLPHQSPHPYLLREASEAVLCGQCHVPELFVTAELHAEYTETSCSACHDPHAAELHGLLRADAPLPTEEQGKTDALGG